MKGIIIDKGEESSIYLKRIFSPINNIQNDYNWLITNKCAYYPNDKISNIFSGKYTFITGEELTYIIEKEDFVWVWGVFSGFRKNISLDEILKYELPWADGYTGFWENPISIQNPLADLEIVAWDGMLTLFISKDESIVEKLAKNIPNSEDLEKYNNN